MKRVWSKIFSLLRIVTNGPTKITQLRIPMSKRFPIVLKKSFVKSWLTL